MNLLVSDLPGTLSNPRFSLDGTKVIFSIDTLYQDKHGRQLNAKICSINVDGTNWKRLTDKTKVDGTNDLQARFSQTGGNIIFLNVASDGDGTKRIFKMNVDGSNRKEIILNGEMPEWINL
jgi:TolB protein